MMIKTLMHFFQHMEMNPLLFTVIWYQLLSFSPQKHLKVCWWIRQLQSWVALMIIQILHHMPKKWGGVVLIPFFCTFPQFINFNQTKFVAATLIAEASLQSLYSTLGFKVIEDFRTFPSFELACKQFNYKSGNPTHCRKNNWLAMLSNHPTTCYNYLWQSNWLKWK